VPAYPGINVVFGSAPLHLRKDGRDYINKPRIYNRYEDAVAELGYSTDWQKYDLCEHMDALFVEFGMFPVIYIAVNDPEDGKTVMAPKQLTLVAGQVDSQEDLIAWSIKVKDDTGTTDYEETKDYLLSLSKNLTWVITRVTTGAIPNDNSVITLEGDHPNPSGIDSGDIIGGIDINSGQRKGLEVIEDVFQATARVPGVIICPAFSKDPLVASVMETKSENINGCFACTCLIDVDTNTVLKAQDVNAWKNTNNIVFPRQELLFGQPALIGLTQRKVYHFASQQGPLLQWTDTYRGGGLPYCSPSNKNLKMNALLLENGGEINMHLFDANMLNSQGVITALNWIGGWRSWGNRTAVYPSSTDVKDMFIPVRRMFDFVGNTIVLTIWQKVDEPGNRRLIDAVVNSIQQWLDGLANQEALLGARIEFRHDENPTVEILNGHYVFHVYVAVPTPAEWLDFKIEYWVPYIQNLWPEAAGAAA
jgi:hypothetical protein